MPPFSRLAPPSPDGESDLARELDGVATGPDGRHLLLDFTNVKYLQSTDLSTLIALHKRVETGGGRLTLFNLNDLVFQLFTITRLDTFLDICREVKVAVSDAVPASS